MVQRNDAGAAIFKPVHGDAVAEPATEQAGEGDDEKSSAEHARGQHGGLRDADHGKLKQLAGAEQARIAEGCKNRHIASASGLRQHLETDRSADLRLRPARDVGRAPWGRDSADLDSRRRRCAASVEHGEVAASVVFGLTTRMRI